MVNKETSRPALTATCGRSDKLTKINRDPLELVANRKVHFNANARLSFTLKMNVLAWKIEVFKERRTCV